MNRSDLDSSTSLPSDRNILTTIRDARLLQRKNLAINLILTSILFERVAYYTLAANLAINLDDNEDAASNHLNLSIITMFFIGK